MDHNESREVARFSLRIPAALHKRMLDRVGKEPDKKAPSLNQLIIDCCEECLDRQDRADTIERMTRVLRALGVDEKTINAAVAALSD